MTDIYQIKIGFRAHNSAIALNYDNLMDANVAWAALNDLDSVTVEIKDNGGSRVLVSLPDIMFLIWTDVLADAKMSGELQLNQARFNAKLQAKASADPELKAAQTVQNIANGGRPSFQA